ILIMMDDYDGLCIILPNISLYNKHNKSLEICLLEYPEKAIDNSLGLMAVPQHVNKQRIPRQNYYIYNISIEYIGDLDEVVILMKPGKNMAIRTNKQYLGVVSSSFIFLDEAVQLSTRRSIYGEQALDFV
ncbi:hypothetical protein ACJX0J_042585, partial [Zea mays]